MNDSRREVLRLLAELGGLVPEIRLGQMLAFLGTIGESQFGSTLWDIEDEELLELLKQHHVEMSALVANRRSQVAPAEDSLANSPTASTSAPASL